MNSGQRSSHPLSRSSSSWPSGSQASQPLEFDLPADEHGGVEGQQLAEFPPGGKPRVDVLVDVQVAPSDVPAVLVDVSTSDQPRNASTRSDRRISSLSGRRSIRRWFRPHDNFLYSSFERRRSGRAVAKAEESVVASRLR
jgi:hypothetical protein